MFYCYVWWRVPSCHKISYCKQVVVNHQPIGVIISYYHQVWKMTSVVAINVLMVCNVDDSNGSFLQLGPTRFKGRKRIRQTPDISSLHVCSPWFGYLSTCWTPRPADCGCAHPIVGTHPPRVCAFSPQWNSREICHFLLALDWFKEKISTENHGLPTQKILVNHKLSTIN